MRTNPVQNTTAAVQMASALTGAKIVSGLMPGELSSRRAEARAAHSDFKINRT
jgi:hypothetical protein